MVSEYIANMPQFLSNGRSWKYLSGKYEFIRSDGSSEIFYLKSAQAKLLCTLYERLGFNDIKLLTEIHQSDIPKWERI